MLIRPSPNLGLVLAALVAAGCGKSVEESPPADRTPPEIQEVSAMLGEPNPGTLDLAAGDVTRIVTGPVPLTFRVLIDDDVTGAEELEVELFDPAAPQTPTHENAELDNGLWRVATTARPGISVGVRALDAAGNETAWPNVAIFPSRAEAIEREWTRLRYDGEATVVEQRPSRWMDGTWCDGGDMPAGGTWSVDDDVLTVEVRHRMSCDQQPPAAVWETVEQTRRGPFFVDDTYFASRPFERVGSGAGVAGRWVVQGAALVDGAASPEELDLGDDGRFVKVGPDGSEKRGAWEPVENGGYEQNFGDLLIFTVEEVDDEPIEPRAEVSFYLLRGDRLLLDPRVDTR